MCCAKESLLYCVNLYVYNVYNTDIQTVAVELKGNSTLFLGIKQTLELFGNQPMCCTDNNFNVITHLIFYSLIVLIESLA